MEWIGAPSSGAAQMMAWHTWVQNIYTTVFQPGRRRTPADGQSKSIASRRKLAQQAIEYYTPSHFITFGLHFDDMRLSAISAISRPVSREMPWYFRRGLSTTASFRRPLTSAFRHYALADIAGACRASTNALSSVGFSMTTAEMAADATLRQLYRHRARASMIQKHAPRFAPLAAMTAHQTRHMRATAPDRGTRGD